MQTVKDQSFGVIPVFKQSDGTSLFCVIERQKVDWTIPKGRRKPGESEEAAARRELWEETGITEVELVPGAVFNQEFEFEQGGVLYHKTVKYFLGFVSSMNVATPEEFKKEVSDTKWLPFEEAREIMSYDNAKVLLDQVWEYLNKKEPITNDGS